MNSILKYEVSAFPMLDTVHIPQGAKLLCVKEQNNHAVLYVEGDLSRPLVPRHIYVYNTGKELYEDNGKYLGTVLLDNGAYVVHYYERKDSQDADQND